MKKIFLIILLVIPLSSCRAIDEEQLKADLKEEIKTELTEEIKMELTEEISEDYMDFDKHLQEVTSEIVQYTVSIKVEVSSSVSIGSGILVEQLDNTYKILTNEHVIRYADKIEVFIPSLNKYFEATLVKESIENDLALISITTSENLNVYTIKDVNYNVGQFVLAVGTSTSIDYVNSITLGIISKISDDRIQHDAAINSGNSGGPLFNLSGELIGINVSKINVTTVGNSVVNVDGMGFSISLDTIIEFVNN